MPQPFLHAEWRKLIMANYVVPAAILEPHLPFGTELDSWEGRHFVSLVGFMFLKTRLLGVPIPGHRNFEEVNLRFYVRHFDGLAWRRGVVFISEIVPRPAIALVANTVYGEKYTTCRMRHQWHTQEDNLRVSYAWKRYGRTNWNVLSVETLARPAPLIAGSATEFITEHYWGYAKRGPRRTFEYAVAHPRWDVYEVLHHEIICEVADLYGPEFVAPLTAPPTSVFLAEGSVVTVGKKRVMRDE